MIFIHVLINFKGNSMSKMRMREFVFLSMALSGCASNASKKVDSKVSQENGVQTRKALQAEAQSLIEHDAELTTDQKSRLSILSSSLSQQLDAMNLESVKLRSVLVKEVLSPDYQISEVEVIKGRMRGLESRRVDLMFSGIEQANVILGRGPADNRRVLSAFINYGRAGIRD
jgi:hypothetical protein